MIEIKTASVISKEAIELMNELSSVLKKITGCSGSASFHPKSLEKSRTVFLIAYMDDKPVGCGALQAYEGNIAEIKRVYAKVNGAGIGSKIVSRLEQAAIDFGYEKILLETRKVNKRAVQFYLSNGYEIGENYGKYKNLEEAVCFFKNIKAESLR